MPFDLGHHVARPVPVLRPIAEAGKVAAHLVRWSPNRALEQVSDPVLQDRLAGSRIGQPDRVADPLGFKKLIYLGVRESRVAPEIEALHAAPIARDYRRQHRAPA